MSEQLGKVKTLEAKLKQLELDAEVHDLEAQTTAEAMVKELSDVNQPRIIAEANQLRIIT